MTDAEIDTEYREIGFHAPADIGQQELDLCALWLTQITAERRRAHAKHGRTSMEQAGTLEHRRASILMEEAAECGKALNDHEHTEAWLFTDPTRDGPWGDRGEPLDELDKELIQTGTMAFTWWANRHNQTLPAPPEPVKLPPDLIELLHYLAGDNLVIDQEYLRRRAREALGL